VPRPEELREPERVLLLVLLVLLVQRGRQIGLEVPRPEELREPERVLLLVLLLVQRVLE
jgi:hypothetical protein